MTTQRWNDFVQHLSERITALAGDAIDVRGVEVQRQSTPDEEWVNVTVRVPDANFAPEYDEAFYRFNRAVRRTVDDVLGEHDDFQVLYVSDEAARARHEHAA